MDAQTRRLNVMSAINKYFVGTPNSILKLVKKLKSSASSANPNSNVKMNLNIIVFNHYSKS